MSIKKHVLIIGGTKGAGQSAVNEFYDDGYIVSVIGQNKTTNLSSKANYYYFNILDKEKCNLIIFEIFQANGPITSVVFFQRYRGEAKNQWDGEINTSLTATKNIIEILVENLNFKNGTIVIVNSINSKLISKGLDISYHICKAALTQMVRYYAVELGNKNIRINSISPGTFLKKESINNFSENKELLDLYNKIIPLNRIATVEEIIHSILFLSTLKSFITGQDIIIDGGLSLVYQESLARNLIS